MIEKTSMSSWVCAPGCFGAINGNGASFNPVKTHNANTQAFGVDLIPPQVTNTAIYILRNPLDVTLSAARHFGKTHDVMVDAMCRSDHVIGTDETMSTQYLGSWSDHVSSWAGESRFPVLVVRYEDMLADPHGCFTSMLRHVGAPIDEARLEKAVRFSSFDELSKQEDEKKFKERSKNTEKFFASGKSGQWQTDLDPDLIKKLRKTHRKLMKKYGYDE